MATALISHPSCLLHETGPAHPEAPQRLEVINDHLLAAGVLDLLQHHEAPAVSREQLLRVHRASHLEWLEQRVPESGLEYIDPDTLIGPDSLTAACHAAGAAVLAADLVIGGRAENAFCNVRPPGHHASSDRAMGFCLFNNVAVGVAHALAAHGLLRIAVFDFDVHHGNGTDVIFAKDPRVLVCSLFQKDLYPFGSGLPHGGFGVDVALSPGCGGEDMREAVRRGLLPALREFDPQMIFVSAGFDAHVEDDISDLRFTDSDYAWLTRQVVDLAAEFCNGRLVSVLEGGYSLAALGRSVTLHVRGMAGI
jgi:acetoin utilization deacetylase AcuC-like enzyme